MIPAVSLNTPYSCGRTRFGQQATPASPVPSSVTVAKPPEGNTANMKTSPAPTNGNGNGVSESGFMSSMSGGRGSMPISRFFFIGAFIAAGSMAMRGLVEYAIPWTWTALTGH